MLVILDGSGSQDPEGAALTYQWTQVGGPAVTLDLLDPAHPTFTAPTVTVGGATVTFQLVVSDGQLTSSPDTVDITVKNVNNPPLADAGPDQTVNEGSAVTLNGSASFDPDGDTLTFTWLQTAGPTVVLAGANTAMPMFTAPLVGSAGELLTFALTVSDGVASGTDAVSVTVDNVNHAPTADAGPDQTTTEGSVVTLDGSGSRDPDGDRLTYAWVQLGGMSIALSDPLSPTPSFTAPQVAPGGATLTFQLTVDDGQGATATDEVAVFVKNMNDPPVCDAARAKPNLLWPPNHQLVPVAIVGVTDTDKDPVTITPTAVTQDEPVDGLGDGDTSPDAMIQSGAVGRGTATTRPRPCDVPSSASRRRASSGFRPISAVGRMAVSARGGAAGRWARRTGTTLSASGFSSSTDRRLSSS